MNGLFSDPTDHPSYVGTFSEIEGHEVRPAARYSDPKPQCVTCSVRSICDGCRHDEGCDWCNCDGMGCSGCGTKCRGHEDRELWQADLGSFDLWVDLEGQENIALPRYVPAVKAREKMREHFPKWTYTIAVNDLIRADGTPREVAYRVRGFFPEGSQLILNFFCEDRYLEPIYTAGEDFFKQGWLEQFDAIMGVNYSLYTDDSSFEILNSQKRSVWSAQEIHDAGHAVIPLLSYVSMTQLYEQFEAYGASGVNTVVVNMQVLDAAVKAEMQEKNVECLRYVAQRTRWRVIVYGIAKVETIETLVEIFGPERLVVANSEPFFHALRRHRGARRRTFAEGLKRFLSLAQGGEGATAGATPR